MRHAAPRAPETRAGGHELSDLGHVLILAGGLSPEREVSLRSGARLRDALREAGVDADIADADAGLIPAVIADPPSAVYPAIHGASGEDGSIQEVLTLLGLPYVGALPDACRFAFDKPAAKAIARAAGLATPPSVTLPKETFHDLGAGTVLDRIVATLGLPLFVKPARGGSALGATLVDTAEDLSGAMISCFAYGDTALIEQCVLGTEVAVGVIDLGRRDPAGGRWLRLRRAVYARADRVSCPSPPHPGRVRRGDGGGHHRAPRARAA